MVGFGSHRVARMIPTTTYPRILVEFGPLSAVKASEREEVKLEARFTNEIA
jgi:hypothetical protein